MAAEGGRIRGGYEEELKMVAINDTERYTCVVAIAVSLVLLLNV
jgi:hypothetical protein